MKRKLNLVFLVLLTFVFLLPVHAQASYQQPMEGVYWQEHTLNVHIPLTPTYVHSIINRSLQAWNEAQTWFISKYESQATGKPQYAFAESNVNPQITIQYVNTLGTKTGALTTFNGQTTGALDKVTISIVLAAWSSEQLLGVLDHELGHALGLAHTQLLYDLMSTSSDPAMIPYPSTLNLYPVYLLARGFDVPKQVDLPSSIPYMEWQLGMALPEFSFTPVLGLLITFLTVGVLRKHRVFQ